MATNLEIIQDAISTDTIAQLTSRQQDLYRQTDKQTNTQTNQLRDDP